MGNFNFILTYVESCANGKLSLAECGPAWQMLVIIVLLVLAVSMLAALRVRSGMQAGAG